MEGSGPKMVVFGLTCQDKGSPVMKVKVILCFPPILRGVVGTHFFKNMKMTKQLLETIVGRRK